MKSLVKYLFKRDGQPPLERYRNWVPKISLRKPGNIEYKHFQIDLSFSDGRKKLINACALDTAIPEGPGNSHVKTILNPVFLPGLALLKRLARLHINTPLGAMLFITLSDAAKLPSLMSNYGRTWWIQCHYRRKWECPKKNQHRLTESSWKDSPHMWSR